MVTPSGALITLLILNPKKFLISTLYDKLKRYPSSVDDVDNDWEMGVGQDHLELVADSDSSDHVSDDTFSGSQHGVSLLLLEPHPEFD